MTTTFEFEPLRVELRCLSDVLRSIIHTILFQRALGKVAPEDGCIEILELYYPQCSDEKIQDIVNERVEEFRSMLTKKSESDNDPSRVHKIISKNIIGYEKVDVTTIPWEQWIFPIQILELDFAKKEERKIRLSYDLQLLLSRIVKTIASRQTHLPPLTISIKDDVTPFPFKIGPVKTTQSWSVSKGLMDMFKSPDIISF